MLIPGWIYVQLFQNFFCFILIVVVVDRVFVKCDQPSPGLLLDRTNSFYGGLFLHSCLTLYWSLYNILDLDIWRIPSTGDRLCSRNCALGVLWLNDQ